MMSVSLEMIQEARKRIGGSIYETFLMETTSISRLTGLHVKLDPENLQKTGSFKIRGATNKISLLTADERQRGIVAASAGNHALGVAHAAGEAGIDATIVMPKTTSLAKLEAMRAYSAKIVLEGPTYDDAAAHARKLQGETGATFIPAFDDPDVIAGQGGIGLDIIEQWPEVETVVVSIGGGGLISGIATAVKSVKPEVKIVGVEASGAASAKRALEEGYPVALDSVLTLADGIAVKQVGEMTFPIIQQYVDEVVTVDEDEIAASVLMLLEKCKIVVEGSGAAPLAAVLYRKGIARGSNIVPVLSGGNIDVNTLGKIIDGGLAKSGRFMTIEIALDDVPGSLHALLGEIAELEANVLTVEHNRTSASAPFGKALVTLYLETRGYGHIENINNSLGERYEIRTRG